MNVGRCLNIIFGSSKKFDSGRWKRPDSTIRLLTKMILG